MYNPILHFNIIQHCHNIILHQVLHCYIQSHVIIFNENNICLVFNHVNLFINNYLLKHYIFKN